MLLYSGENVSDAVSIYCYVIWIHSTILAAKNMYMRYIATSFSLTMFQAYVYVYEYN